MQTRFVFGWLIAAFLLIVNACTASPAPTVTPPAGSCLLHLDAGITDEQMIEAVLAAEGDLVVKQDINQLMGLWTENSLVADAGNTPDQADDDQLWRNQDAIRNRYVRIVFPGAPTVATPTDLAIELNGDQALVTATTQIGSEISPAGDRWELVKMNGCWLIKSLTYNLEAANN